MYQHGTYFSDDTAQKQPFPKTPPHWGAGIVFQDYISLICPVKSSPNDL